MKFGPFENAIEATLADGTVEAVMATMVEIDKAGRIVVLKSLAGGIIFDGLLLACARKSQAQRIYTWNDKHFRMVAPDLAERNTTP
jgi:NADH dehydrogenase FAD-containing subunit